LPATYSFPVFLPPHLPGRGKDLCIAWCIRRRKPKRFSACRTTIAQPRTTHTKKTPNDKTTNTMQNWSPTSHRCTQGPRAVDCTRTLHTFPTNPRKRRSHPEVIWGEQSWDENDVGFRNLFSTPNARAQPSPIRRTKRAPADTSLRRLLCLSAGEKRPTSAVISRLKVWFRA